MALEVRVVEPVEVASALAPIWHYFGSRPEPDQIERLGTILPVERMLAAVDGGQIGRASCRERV